MNDFNLTPPQPLPPEVRDRIRARVQQGVRQDRQRRLAPMLAAAATVTALAAAGVVFSAGSQEPFSVGDGDRTSPSATALADCLARATTPVDEYDRMEPGAFVRDGEHLVVAAQSADQISLCVDGIPLQDHGYGQAPTATQPVSIHIQLDYTGGPGEAGIYTTDLAMVGRTHPSVAKLTFSNDGRTFDAGVHDGTFAAHIAAAKLRDGDAASWPIPAKAYDRGGNLIWSGEPERSGRR